MSESNLVRVLHVVGAMNRAGTETMLMNIYRNIDRKRVQFDFVSYQNSDADFDKEIREMGGRVFKLSQTWSIKELYDAINKHGPFTVVHAHTLFHCGIAVLAAKFAGVKIRISHAHTTVDKSDNLIRKIYIKAMRLLIIKFSSRLLACSKEAGRYLFGEEGLSKSNYRFFPNLIDYSKFVSAQELKIGKFKIEKGWDNDTIIGHVGRFIAAKNHKFLLQIFKCVKEKVSNAKLILVGDGDLREDVENAARREGLCDSIIFAGLRDDISIILQSMDVFVFPSIHEGLGLVLLEAQACGLPCVVSEAIQPEADLNINLVSRLSLVDSPEIWADKILEVAGKKEKDTTKIVQGFESNNYALSEGISRLMEIYEIPMECI